MKIGIIGLPNVGKTTIFNALTSNDIPTGNYASQSGEHHLGQVDVPDARLDKLVEIYNPRKRVPATIEFVDVAGISKGAGRQGLSQEMLKFIRDVDALLHVVREFEEDSIMHAEESIDPARDIETINTEMILSDLMLIEKRLERIEKDLIKLPKDRKKDLEQEKEILNQFHAHLENEQPLRSFDASEIEDNFIRRYALLSAKPIMILINSGEDQIESSDEIAAKYAPNSETPTLAICGEIEAEIAQLDEEDMPMFMEEMGITESGLARVIRASYDLLGLHSFFTIGKDEVRAWTLRKGDDAVTAAGKIHTDMARGFIRAECVTYENLIAAGSWSKTKELGTFRLEGKNYVIKDGDVLGIRFNV